MKRLLTVLILLLAFDSSGLQAAPAGSGPVVIIPIRDEIESSIVYVVRRGIREATERGARAVILDMNTPGGRGDAMEEIMELVEGFKGETVTFVNKKALSAGAFIALATKRIWMAPASTIGAAAPILMGPGGDVQQLPSTFQKKISSAFSARLRAAAQRNGHRPELADAMVKETEGLILDGMTVVKKGDILTLTDTEATKRYGKPPAPLLAEGVAADLDDLLAKLGLSGAAVERIEPTGAERIARLITTFAPILLLIGIAGIYLEFKTPGVVLPGVIGVAALVIFFFGHYIAGLSGFEEVLLFVFGLILIGVELFLLPGHVLPGFFGVVCILVSLLWAMVEKPPLGSPLPGMPTMPGMAAFQVPMLKLAGAMIGAAVLVAVLLKILPMRRRAYGGLVLTKQLDKAEGYASAETRSELIGRQGVTLSVLRPSGTARFEEQVVDVITEGEFLPPGARVEVSEVRGAQVMVRKV
ncbi:MAG: nodulation protein NfeD [Verrucomicrobiae bacterium]|nr:nodulation protein NfeD [Verrucomicrobiae bacterium]